MPVRDHVYQALRRAILDCEFQPGQRLNATLLAARYRVSATPVRDALLRLEQENLATVLPREGYRVKPILVADVANVFNLLSLIEPACAAAAARADDVALRALDRFRGFADRMYVTSDYAGYNSSFHAAVGDLAGNRRLATIARGLAEETERMLRLIAHALEHEDILRFCAEHEAIIDAIQARDPDRAGELSREHAKAAHERIATVLFFVEPLPNPV